MICEYNTRTCVRDWCRHEEFSNLGGAGKISHSCLVARVEVGSATDLADAIVAAVRRATRDPH